MAIYLSCQGCGNRFRVEKLEPVTSILNQFHCPACGATVKWSQDISQDYWYEMAEGFGLIPCQESAMLIHAMYDEWTADGRQPSSFRRYVEELKSDAVHP